MAEERITPADQDLGCHGLALLAETHCRRWTTASEAQKDTNIYTQQFMPEGYTENGRVSYIGGELIYIWPRPWFCAASRCAAQVTPLAHARSAANQTSQAESNRWNHKHLFPLKDPNPDRDAGSGTFDPWMAILGHLARPPYLVSLTYMGEVFAAKRPYRMDPREPPDLVGWTPEQGVRPSFLDWDRPLRGC